MTQPDKPYSDPADQRSLADALSQAGGSYSADSLVAALRKKDEPKPTYQAGQGMPPWAADQPPEAAPRDTFGAMRMKPQTPGLLDRAGNWVKEQLSPAPAVAASVTPQGDQQRAQVADQQAAQQRLQGVQMAPTTPDSPNFAGPPPGSGGPAPAPPPKPQTTPEHWVNTMDPASRAAMAAGQGNQLAGVGGQSEAEAAAANEMASAAYHGHEDARVQQLLDQQRLDPERQKLDEHAQQLQAQALKLSQAKVDPEHYMASRSAGQKMMMALALAFSGFSSGLKGGPNQAMEFIKGAIDDDNKAQMQNIENSRGGLEAQKGILADKMKLFGNKEQALAAARQEQLQGVAAQIDDMARQYQSPDILAKAQQLKGQLQEHFAAEGASVNKYVPAATTGGGPTESQLAEKAYELYKGKVAPSPEEGRQAVDYLFRGAQQGAHAGYYQPPGKAAAGSQIDLSEVEKAGRAAIGTKGMGAFVGQHVPAWVAPDSAQQAQTLNHYNNVIIPGVMKNLESRMSPEQIAAAKKELGIKPSDPPQLREQKLQQLLQFGRVGAGVKGKTTTGGDAGPAAGAEALPGEEPLQ